MQFRPPFEEIQSKYYRELKKFMCIPYNFKGVHEVIPENCIFPIMVERNADRFAAVYSIANELFKRLEAVQDEFKVRKKLLIFLIIQLEILN